MTEHLDGIAHEVNAMRELAAVCVTPESFAFWFDLLDAAIVAWREWPPDPDAIDMACLWLKRLRELIAVEQLNYAKAHEGRHRRELGLMSIKVATTKEHLDHIRKGNWEHAETRTSQLPRHRNRKASVPLSGRVTTACADGCGTEDLRDSRSGSGIWGTGGLPPAACDDPRRSDGQNQGGADVHADGAD